LVLLLIKVVLENLEDAAKLSGNNGQSLREDVLEALGWRTNLSDFKEKGSV